MPKSGLRFSDALPEVLRGTAAAEVMVRSIDQDRLGHAYLISGPRLDHLIAFGHAVAAWLLETEVDRVEAHPDFFRTRPEGAGRQISIDSVRNLLGNLSRFPLQADRKVGWIEEAELLNQASFNALLKTLEEPTADSTLLLLSTVPDQLATTIRSRCLRLTLPFAPEPLADPEWRSWCDSVAAWFSQHIDLLSDRESSEADQSVAVLQAIRLVGRYGEIYGRMTEERWKEERQHLPDLEGDQLKAAESGAKRGLRRTCYRELIESLDSLLRQRVSKDRDVGPILRFHEEVEAGDHLARFYVHDQAVLEGAFFAAIQSQRRRR